MTEITPTDTEAASTHSADPKPNRLKVFVANHPRITRASKVTLGLAGVFALGFGAANMKANKEKVADAVDHAKAAGDALSDSVATPDTEA